MVLKGGVGAGLIQAPGHCHWPITVAVPQSRGGGSCCWNLSPSQPNNPFHLGSNLGRQERRGSCPPGRLGDPRAGPHLRTCWVAAHTTPHRRVRLSPLTRSGSTQAPWMLPSPRRRGGKERTGISATTLPDASPMCRGRVGADREPPWGFHTPLSHP